jgi:hypothetical protein
VPWVFQADGRPASAEEILAAFRVPFLNDAKGIPIVLDANADGVNDVAIVVSARFTEGFAQRPQVERIFTVLAPRR